MALNVFNLGASLLALTVLAGAYGCHRSEKAAVVPQRQAVQEQAENTPMAALNGYVWEASGPQSKLDFLLGVECSLAMEAALKQVAEERGGTVELSRFAHGWQIAFRDKARPDIVYQIDEFYRQNPEQKERHVFDVVWMEMIRPAMTAAQR